MIRFRLGLAGSRTQATPLNTAFTFQRYLSDGGSAAHGTYDLLFFLPPQLEAQAHPTIPAARRSVIGIASSHPLEIRAAQHLGPVAQDFRAAFGLGTDDKHIATVDADGVALAAIQGLNDKVGHGTRNAERRMEELEAENAALTERLARLEQLVTLLTSKSGGGGQ